MIRIMATFKEVFSKNRELGSIGQISLEVLIQADLKLAASLTKIDKLAVTTG